MGPSDETIGPSNELLSRQLERQLPTLEWVLCHDAIHVKMLLEIVTITSIDHALWPMSISIAHHLGDERRCQHWTDSEDWRSWKCTNRRAFASDRFPARYIVSSRRQRKKWTNLHRKLFKRNLVGSKGKGEIVTT
jgi:hypothetical protein